MATALPEKNTVKTRTYIAGEDLTSTATTLYVPLKRGTSDNEVLIATAVTDKVVGYLRSHGDIGDPVSVADQEGDLVHAIAGSDAFNAGDDLQLKSGAVTKMTPFTINVAGTTPVEQQGIAEQDNPGDGNLFLMRIKRGAVAT